MEKNLDLWLIIGSVIIIVGYAYWRLVLHTSGKTWFAGVPPSPDLVGKTGVAKSLLRPGGIGVIEGQRMHVMSEGEAIGPGTPVKVLRICGTNIIVSPIVET